MAKIRVRAGPGIPGFRESGYPPGKNPDVTIRVPGLAKPGRVSGYPYPDFIRVLLGFFFKKNYVADLRFQEEENIMWSFLDSGDRFIKFLL